MEGTIYVTGCLKMLTKLGVVDLTDVFMASDTRVLRDELCVAFSPGD